MEDPGKMRAPFALALGTGSLVFACRRIGPGCHVSKVVLNECSHVMCVKARTLRQPSSGDMTPRMAVQLPACFTARCASASAMRASAGVTEREVRTQPLATCKAFCT